MLSIISTTVGETNFGKFKPANPTSIKDKYPNAHINPLSIEIDPDTIAALFANRGVYDWNKGEYVKYNIKKEDLVKDTSSAKATFSPYLSFDKN